MADPIDELRGPQVICRLFSLFFSIIVVGCIADKGRPTIQGEKYCVYGGDDGACDYGVAIGVIAFIACLLFLAADFFMDSISNVQAKKYIYLLDLLFSGLCAYLWFVGFSYLCDKWRKQDDKDQFPSHAKSNAEAAIAFTFFSIISWGMQYFLALGQSTMSGTYQSVGSDQSGEYRPPTY